MSLENIKKTYDSVTNSVGEVIVGKKEVAELALIALLCGGHMLIDDVPGTGKTMLSKTFAESLSLEYKRVQCVPDMLPGDLVGINFFDMKQNEFRFIKGPVFTNILLADEINRAMPKTQSGLLEAMEEHQVSLDGATYVLEEPFMVIATQNPVETKGTFELPEAQLDRFLFRCSMGYPSTEDNLEILRRKFGGEKAVRREDIAPVTAQELAAAQAQVQEVYIHPDLMAYATAIGEATRHDAEVELGASPRAIVHLLLAARGFAATAGRDYVLPDDIKEAAVPTLSHRLVMKNDFYRTRGHDEEIVRRLLEQISVPTEAIDFMRRS